MNNFNDIKLKSKMLQNTTYQSWITRLVPECCVFICDERFVARNLSEINFSFCDESTAKKILSNNIILLLKYKYNINLDSFNDKLKKILSFLKDNLNACLIKIKPENNKNFMKDLPISAVAFNNGIYDFQSCQWLLQFKTLNINETNNQLHLFASIFFIKYHFNISFNPLNVNIMETTLQAFLKCFRAFDYTQSVIKLLCTLSHDNKQNLSLKRAYFLCECFGYNIYNKFINKLLLFNTYYNSNIMINLFENTLFKYLVSSPLSVDLSQLYSCKSDFIPLVNHYQNIVYNQKSIAYNDFLLAQKLLSSTNHSITLKNQIFKYYISCKSTFIFNSLYINKNRPISHFKDYLNIFDLPINLKSPHGTFNDYAGFYDISNLKYTYNDFIIFIYLCMYGIKSATNHFTKDFQFSFNDYKEI